MLTAHGPPPTLPRMAKRGNELAVLWVLAAMVPITCVMKVCGDDEPSERPSVVEPEPARSLVAEPPPEPPPQVEPDPEPEPEPKPAKKKRAKRSPKKKAKSEPATPEPAKALADDDPESYMPPPPDHRPAPVAPRCCKHCGSTSKPCGDSCISLSKTCHKGRGCAC